MNEIDKIIKEQNCSLMCDTVRQIANERNRFEARVKELEEKLKIAEEALKKIPNASYNGASKDELSYIAQQALQKIKEVN